MAKAIEGRENLHVDEHGAGSAVVLLHGAPTAVADFEPLVARLVRRHRVLVPHLPGYGRTPPDAEPASLDELVGRLERRLIDAGVTRTVIVALSAGGYPAVALALRKRIAVSRLVLGAPVIGLDPEVAQAYRQLVAAIRTGAVDPRPSWLDRMASPGFATHNPNGARQVLGWLDAAPLPVVCGELLAMADARDLRPRLREIACPVLVCAGTADGAVPVTWSEALARQIPNGRFELFEGVGHALLIEATERMTDLIDDFVAEPGSIES